MGKQIKNYPAGEQSMEGKKLLPMEGLCLDMGVDVNGVRHYQPWAAYDKDEADTLIKSIETEKDVLKADLKRVNAENDAHCKLMDKVDEKEKRIKELEKEVDSVKMNSGYVAFMEAQARIKELEELIEAYKEAERNNI